MPSINERNIVDFSYVMSIWNEIPDWKETNNYDWRVLHMMWCVFSFEIWAKMYIDNNPLTYSYNGQHIIK